MYPTIVPAVMATVVDDRVRSSHQAAAEVHARREATAAGRPAAIAARARLAVARSLIGLGRRVAGDDAVDLPGDPCQCAARAA